MFGSDLGWHFHITAIKDLARFSLIDTVFACLCVSNEAENPEWLRENTILTLCWLVYTIFKVVILGLKCQLIPADF